MTRENLIDKIAQSMCDSEELLDQALYTLGEKAELDD